MRQRPQRPHPHPHPHPHPQGSQTPGESSGSNAGYFDLYELSGWLGGEMGGFSQAPSGGDTPNAGYAANVKALLATAPAAPAATTPPSSPSGAAWTPTDLSVPILGWWDMQASSTTPTSGDISSLSGVGGRPNATQSDAGKRPTLAATGWDGALPCLTFGTGDLLDSTVSASGQGKPFTYVFVVDWDRTGYLGLVASATPAAHAAYVDSTGVLSIDKQAVENVYSSPASTVKAGKSIIIIRFDGDALDAVSVNGTVTAFTSSKAFGVEGTMQIGNSGGKIDRFAAAMRIDGAVSDDEMLRLDGYMAARWAMTSSLPASHPYKATAPTK